MQADFLPPTDEEEAELRAMLKPRRTPPQPRSRHRLVRRHVVFTAADERAFLRLLRSAYPQFFILAERRYGELGCWEIVPDFSDVSTALGCLPDGDTVPEACIAPGGKLVRRPRLEFEYHPAYHDDVQDRDGFPSASLSYGYIMGTYLISDNEHGRFLHKVARLIGKMATNQMKTVNPETGEMNSPRQPGPWCGFDALRWCRENPRRVLDRWYQPMDDWVMPDSPWYD